MTDFEFDDAAHERNEQLVGWAEVHCPFCFEVTEIAIEADVEGLLVQDCEVCCRPWELRVRRDAEGGVYVEVCEP